MNTNTSSFEKAQILPHFTLTDILMYVVSSGILVLNGGIVVIFLLQHIRKPSNQISPAGLLVLNLLLSDALVGALGISMTASYTHGLTASPYGCVTRAAMRYLFRMGSHVALINVAVDRYVAIMHTLQYRDWVTIERSLALIGIGWLIPVGGVAYAFIANDWKPGLNLCSQIQSFSIFITYIRLPSHLLALLVVVLIQCRIYLQLKHYEEATEHKVLRRYSHKSARTLFWVTSTYVVCWLPFDTMLLLIMFLPQPSTKIIFDGTVILAHSSFLVNAFVFSYKTENIRKPVSEFCSDIWKAVTCKGSSNPANISGVFNEKRHASLDTTTSQTTTSLATAPQTTTTSGSVLSTQLAQPPSNVILHI